MEWIRTLIWIVRGSPWGFALTVALILVLYILVPIKTPESGTTGVVAASEVRE